MYISCGLTRPVEWVCLCVCGHMFTILVSTRSLLKNSKPTKIQRSEDILLVLTCNMTILGLDFGLELGLEVKIRLRVRVSG